MKVCPRCGKSYDRLLSLSRKDNKTMICDNCGTEEAMLDMMGKADFDKDDKEYFPFKKGEL